MNDRDKSNFCAQVEKECVVWKMNGAKGKKEEEKEEEGEQMEET